MLSLKKSSQKKKNYAYGSEIILLWFNLCSAFEDEKFLQECFVQGVLHSSLLKGKIRSKIASWQLPTLESPAFITSKLARMMLPYSPFILVQVRCGYISDYHSAFLLIIWSNLLD
jgi:hypothetical protein